MTTAQTATVAFPLMENHPPAPGTVPTGENPSKKSPSFYRPELDVLRFVAFMMIFFQHLGTPNFSRGTFGGHHGLVLFLLKFGKPGDVALPVFYVMSSFLVTSLLLQERHKTGSIHLIAFYTRRLLRLWPLYLSFMLFVYVLGHFWAPAMWPLREMVFFLLFVGNLVFLNPAIPANAIVGTLWSVSLEEQYYLVWPLLISRLSKQAIGIISVVLLVGSLASNAWFSTQHEFWRLRFVTASNISFFAMGALLSLRYGLFAQDKSVVKFFGGLALAVCTWIPYVLLSWPLDMISSGRAVASYALLSTTTLLVVWSFLHMPQSWIHPKVVYLGRISFGLYVFHGLMLTICRMYLSKMPLHTWAIPAFVLTLMTAMLSYRFLEKPFLRLKYKFEFVHSR